MRLLAITSSPLVIADGKAVLNTKFVVGMTKFANDWDGPVECLVPLQDAPDAFSESYDMNALPFGIRHRIAGTEIKAADLRDADIILASADMHGCLDLVPLVRSLGKKIVYFVELDPATRRQIVRLDPARTRLQRFKSLLWLKRHEKFRRRAIKTADGLQMNGYPAWDTYAHLNPEPFLYLDNRISSDLLATPEEMAARETQILQNEPLQIVHSGRLEPIKGSQRLVEIARKLREKGMRFDLHIFGTGSLEETLRRQAAAVGLSQVHFHGAVYFSTELVPFCRSQADLFLSLHLQSDPSCTYLESFGCGLPILGFDNRMWDRLQGVSRAGWVAPLENVEAVVDHLLRIDKKRHELCEARARALKFASDRLFEAEFQRRIDHLRHVTGPAGA